MTRIICAGCDREFYVSWRRSTRRKLVPRRHEISEGVTCPGSFLRGRRVRLGRPAMVPVKFSVPPVHAIALRIFGRFEATGCQLEHIPNPARYAVQELMDAAFAHMFRDRFGVSLTDVADRVCRLRKTGLNDQDIEQSLYADLVLQQKQKLESHA